jgi:signal transduction histidine kinase
MNGESAPFVLSLLLAAGLSALLAYIAWRRRPAPGATAVTVLMVTAMIWSVGYALEFASRELATILFWARLQYFGIVSLPVGWLAFALQYTGRERWLTRRALAALVVLPVITVVLVLTNNSHGLIWQETSLESYQGLVTFSPSYGPWFWVHTIYSYLLLLAGTLMLFLALLRSPHLYRNQAGTVIGAALLPWLANVIYLGGLTPWPYLDLTPFAFVGTGLLLAWGLFRFQLLDVVPVARDVVVESMEHGVIVLDERERIVDLNAAAEGILALSRESLLGHAAAQVLPDWFGLIHPVKGASDSRPEIVLGTGNSHRFYEPLISPLRNRRHQVIGQLVMIYDVTERRRGEDERQERLRAEEAVRARDLFISVASHELWTPITTLAGYADLLQRHNRGEAATNPRLERGLQVMAEQSERLNRLITYLMDLSRIQSGRLVLRQEPVDLGVLVARVVAALQPVLEQHTLDLRMGEGPHLILGDEMRLEQVVQNLVNNAIKYSPAGGPVILDVRRQDDQLCLTITDEGIGIPEQSLPQLFDPFYRADNVGEHEIEGSGLGLAVVREVVDRHDGSIHVRSTEGRGSVFTVCFPLLAGNAG